MHGAIHGLAVKLPERFYCVTHKEPCDLFVIKAWAVHVSAYTTYDFSALTPDV
jgi:hypothetical protein